MASDLELENVSAVKLLDDHQLTTVSHQLARQELRKTAECSCGNVVYDWPQRDQQHQRHLYAVIWGAGYRDGVRDEQLSQDWTDSHIPPARANPFEKASAQ